MKRIVLSLSILLLAATESHALRSGSANTLTVQNGAATVACTTASGAATGALLYDVDGTGSTNSSCLVLPTNCSTDRFLRWNTSNNTLTCDLPAASGSALTSFIVTQSQSPFAYDSVAPVKFMGLGGAVRDTSSSFVRLSPNAVTVSNMYCNTHGAPTAGQATVTLSYNTAGNFGATTSSANLSVVISSTSNVAAAVQAGPVTIPAGAYVGYKIDMTGYTTFPSINNEQGVDISCTLERTA